MAKFAVSRLVMYRYYGGTYFLIFKKKIVSGVFYVLLLAFEGQLSFCQASTRGCDSRGSKASIVSGIQRRGPELCGLLWGTGETGSGSEKTGGMGMEAKNHRVRGRTGNSVPIHNGGEWVEAFVDPRISAQFGTGTSHN